MQPVSSEPVCFGVERLGTSEIGTENGAVHRTQIGRPPPVWSRFDMRGPPDMGVAGGHERPQGVVINEFDGAGGRDSNAEGCHERFARPRSIPA